MVAVLLLLIAASAPAATAAEAPNELVGLWKARRWFGPAARGRVIVERKGADYTADMMGQRLPVRVDAGELSFALPRDEGRFRGRLRKDGAIQGHWTPARSVAMGGHTTPLVLSPSGTNRWRGEVAPFDDVFTFYLLLRERPDGSLSALLRNMERDWGAWLGVERLVREGNRVTLRGRRPGQAEEREISAGSYDPVDSVLTLSFPSRGGSYDFHRDDAGSDYYPRGLRPERYAYRPPPERADGWTVGTLEEVGIDRAAVEAFVQAIVDMPMDSVDTPQMHGLLIARHGKLVLEEYFHGEHRDRLHDTRSASKSVTATLVGAALQAGAPIDLSTPVYQVMDPAAYAGDGLDPRKRAMTLEHLLAMTSGYYCNDSDPNAPGNEQTMIDQTEEPDYYRYTLQVPMAFAPGDTAIYCSGSSNLALGVLGRATGESPLDLFDRLLGGPMQIERYGWTLDPAGNPFGGGSVQFLPRDFMKFGQLMLDGGTWRGRRILSREFVARASSPMRRIGRRSYGLQWWAYDYPRADRPVRVFAALGTGGQSVTVVPELDLVIAGFGGSYASRGYRYVTDVLIPRFILPAIGRE